jgi:hypothetical protein
MRDLSLVCQCNVLTGAGVAGPPFIEGEHLVENSAKLKVLDKLITKVLCGVRLRPSVRPSVHACMPACTCVRACTQLGRACMHTCVWLPVCMPREGRWCRVLQYYARVIVIAPALRLPPRKFPL